MSFINRKEINENNGSSFGESKICRVCLSNENSNDNPLISPCICSGTMKYIHIECLNHWFKNKGQISSTKLATVYYWDLLYCELCKTKIHGIINRML